MESSDTIAVRRPQRWDEPMDPRMTGEDVAWLLTKSPFSSLDPTAFPRTLPLDGILKNDCRLHRVTRGQVIVRDGDYANSAFLILDGAVELVTRKLTAAQLDRDDVRSLSWLGALKQFFRPSDVRESRKPSEVAPRGNWQSVAPATHFDRQPAPPWSGNLSGELSAGDGQRDSPPVLFLQDFDGLVRAGQTATLGPGELFGEVAAMVRSAHAATVVAASDATLLEIRWQGLKMLRRDRAFADRMEEHYRQHWLPLHLREIPLLRYLPEDSLQRVVLATQLRSFGRLEWNADYRKTRQLPAAEQIQSEPVVCVEGAQVTDLIVVRSGFGRICRQYGAGRKTTAYLGKGHLFGLDEITQSVIGQGGELATVPYQRSLLAVGFLDTLHIPVECFAAEILPYVRRSELPAGAAALLLDERGQPRQRRRQTRGTTVRPRSDVADTRAPIAPPAAEPTWQDLPSPTGTTFQPTGLLEFIVQHRFLNGQHAMLIDLHRCTRCDDCVKACANVHDGNPRFARIGPSHERLQWVQACMHCADPVCMIGCPTGAIHRDEATGLVRISEPICIGCGTCSASCPYDAIEMVSVRDASGRQYTDAASGKPISKATKCDLCSGLPSGPACQAACPHDALVRIDLTQSQPLEAWLKKR